jgi:predicted aconitase with swiveling domain
MFMSVAQKGIAPAAMLFARHVDSLAATGLIMADNWLEKRSIAVDLLGDDFLDAAMQPNASVKVSEDGTVEVSY